MEVKLDFFLQIVILFLLELYVLGIFEPVIVNYF